ncbi:MAG: OsmC family protein [Pseudomonadota bacterium]
MAVHKAKVVWESDGQPFTPKTYTRNHRWHFEGGETLAASAAPAYLGDASCVDPEEAFTASLSACHMLTFLYLAAVKGLVVTRYEDEAEGTLGRTDRGMAMTRVVLRPLIEFEGDQPAPELLDQLHEQAHKDCFIANSVTTVIDVEAR